MHPAVEEIARQLREVRVARGMSQGNLSERIGITQAQVSRFEGGRADLRLGSLVELGRGLGPRDHAGAAREGAGGVGARARQADRRTVRIARGPATLTRTPPCAGAPMADYDVLDVVSTANRSVR